MQAIHLSHVDPVHVEHGKLQFAQALVALSPNIPDGQLVLHALLRKKNPGLQLEQGLVLGPEQRVHAGLQVAQVPVDKSL